MRRTVLAVAFVAVLTAPALAQERTFSVTMGESQWNKLGDLLTDKPWKDVNPIISAITRDVGKALQQDAGQRQQDLTTLKQLADENADLKKKVDELTKEVEKLKAPQAPPPEEEPK